MHKNCKRCNSTDSVSHTNAFATLDGIPYLVAEYLDRRAFQQIDESAIESGISIDQSNCMRTVIDISIDDIGHKARGGLNVIGNSTKQKNLITLIKNNLPRFGGQLPVLKRGIVLKVFYHLENKRTGQVMRSLTEDLRIPERSYFVNINGSDINDNAIIVNFSNTMVSTVNEFTHGMDPLVLRITGIKMYYERVKPGPKAPVPPRHSMICDPKMAQYFYGCDADLYDYHKHHQNKHFIGDPHDYHDDALPPAWTMLNRFYHFDEYGKDIIIHDQEVYDPRTRTILVPCGTVNVNRTFNVNPGSRLIFKLSVWKNDITVVNDVTDIALSLKAPVYPCDCGCMYNTDDGSDESDDQDKCSCPNNNSIDEDQNAAIKQLNDMVNSLVSIIKEMHPDMDMSDIIPGTSDGTACKPDHGDHGCKPKPPHHHHINGLKAIFNKLESIQETIDDLECDCEDVTPIPNGWIADTISGLGNK